MYVRTDGSSKRDLRRGTEGGVVEASDGRVEESVAEGSERRGKTTRNSCRSGTTLGRVSPHRGPHARPVSAPRIRSVRYAPVVISRPRASFARGRQVETSEAASRVRRMSVSISKTR